jgi:DNA-binding NtrC family response regulator
LSEERIRLTVTGPTGATASVVLHGPTIRIGRDDACELHVDDAELSRSHAELRNEGGRWTVRDCGSRNGTRRNGRVLDGPALLSRGDEICVGRTRIVFDATPDDAAVRGATQVSPHGDEPDAIVGDSPAIAAVLETVRRIAPATCPVLVLGENGTGKELVARRLHALSLRAAGPYVVVNCPALPAALLEAELFGVERGVATGVEPREGRIESARGGTLLLDEVGDLEPAAQAKLLRVLETKQVDRIGGRLPVSVDVRVVAATNHDLRADVEAGRFRRDLFHRLDTVTIRLPPLRERRGDIDALVRHFVRRSARPDASFSPAAMAVLTAYDFPGNVRELENAVEHACLLAQGPEIGPRDLPESVRGGGTSAAAELLDRIVSHGESFWDVVATPYLRRDLPREEVVRFVEAAHVAAGGSYKGVAALLRLEGEYKRLLNFLHHHDLGRRGASAGD